jgi:lipase chaperone LimK
MPSASKAGTSSLRFPLAIAAWAAAATAACVAVYQLLAPAPPAARPPEQAGMPQETRFGPGLWRPGAAEASAAVPGELQEAATALLPGTAADGQLRIDLNLKALFELFLLGRREGARAAHIAQLNRFLEQQLPQSAAGQAANLVQKYAAYMDEHDAQLRRTGLLSTPNALASQQLDTLAAWKRQRAQLRLAAFGQQVAQTWFAEEDAVLQQALDAAIREAGAPDMAATPRPAIQHANLQQHEDRLRQELLADASKLFSDLEKPPRK